MDLHAVACQHAYHRVLETIHVHLDIDFERSIGFRLAPTGTKLMPQHSFYHGFEAVHSKVLIAIFAFAAVRGQQSVQKQTTIRSIYIFPFAPNRP